MLLLVKMPVPEPVPVGVKVAVALGDPLRPVRDGERVRVRE